MSLTGSALPLSTTRMSKWGWRCCGERLEASLELGGPIPRANDYGEDRTHDRVSVGSVPNHAERPQHSPMAAAVVVAAPVIAVAAVVVAVVVVVAIAAVVVMTGLTNSSRSR